MKKGQTSPPWSGEELRFLRENYAEHTAAWIGRRLGRSHGAVIKQARRIGLSKKRGRPLKGSVYVKFKRNRKTNKKKQKNEKENNKERRRTMSRQLSFTDYDGFCEKFKPKKTADDCYTPPASTNPIWNQQRITIELNKIYNEDCIEGMKRIPNKSVDMVLCDLPYGTTQLKWDIRLPFDKLWEQWLRVCKENAAIVLFSSQPFTTDLINSNRKMFKYEIIWKKTQRTGFFDAKKRPLRLHENILLFYGKQPTYNPQKVIKENAVGVGRRRGNSDFMKTNGGFVGKVGKEKAETYYYEEKGWRYPTDVIEFSNWNGALFGNTDRSVKHPTQKPVALCEYLIKTFSNDGDVVLDSCMGSGTTAVAAVNTCRNFIGFETDADYCIIANERIERAIIHDFKKK